MNKKDIEAALIEDKLRSPGIRIVDEIHTWEVSNDIFRKPEPVTNESYHFLILDCPPVVFELVEDETFNKPENRADLILKNTFSPQPRFALFRGVCRLKISNDITVSFDFGDSFLVFEGPELFVEDYDLMEGDNLETLLDWIQEGGECPLVSPYAPIAKIAHKYV